MSSTPDPNPPRFLPAEWAWERELARGTQGIVHLVRRGPARGVLRLFPGTTGGLGPSTELAVLSEVRHGGLAALVDHGVIASTGERFLLREWIEGVDLAERAGRLRSEGSAGLERIGRIVAELCPALEHLHQSGFVHGDLKASNVIVRADDRPVLTDLGLALARGHARAEPGVSGTLFALAPEVLMGEPADARSDLFALGVMLHELLLARRVSAREFYARFPEQDFFTATGTRIDDLPEWARDVVAGLLERDPRERMTSALEVARTLAPRVGARVPVELPEPRWPTRQGREAWFERCTESLRAKTAGARLETRSAPRWLVMAEGEACEAVLDELRLGVALHGEPVRKLVLARDAGGAFAVGELDRLVRDEAHAAHGGLVFAAATDSPLDVRFLEMLWRTMQQRSASNPEAEPALLVVGSRYAPTIDDVAWRVERVPGVDAPAVEGVLAREFDDAPERRAEFARLLVRESGGAAAAIDLLLREARGTGALVPAERGWRIAPAGLGALGGASRARRGELLRGLEPRARRLRAALHVAGDRASLDTLIGLVGEPAVELSRSAARLVEYGLCERTKDARGFVLRGETIDVAALDISEDEWRALHAARAAMLEQAGAEPSTILPHAWRAEPGPRSDARAVDLLREHREHGFPERAVELHAMLARAARSAPACVSPAIEAEVALAWIAMGRTEKALSCIEASTSSSEPAVQSLVACVKGEIAVLEHDWPTARDHFERAAALADPAAAFHGLGRIFYETRRDDDLERLCLEARGRRRQPLPRRVVDSLENLRAMSRFRRGDHAAALASLELGLEESLANGDRAREAGVRINLATVLRRGGRMDTALEHARNAEALYDAAGHLPGLAQARALVAGILRDLGELEQAEPHFVSALELRERLGDYSGAAAVRGMLGFAKAERGHVRGAQLDLEHAAKALERGGRASFAAPLVARAEELRARFELPGRVRGRTPRTEAARAEEADPRILVSRAREQWLAGDRPAAVECARRASQLASRLAQPMPEAEARLLLDALRRTGERSVDAGEGARVKDEERTAPLVHEDRAVLEVLASDLADPERATAGIVLARGLASRGRDDRAARVALALVARSGERTIAAESRALFDSAFERCRTGLTDAEAERLTNTLLSIPDPWPADLAGARASGRTAAGSDTDEEFEMDIALLLELNHRLVTQEALGDLLGEIVESALTVTGAERGFLVLEEDGELSFDTALDSRRGDIATPDLEVSKSIVRQTLEAGRVLRLSNAIDDPLLAGAPSVAALELRSILCAPFDVEPNLRGVIYLDHRLQQGAFAAKAERLLALLADQAVLAIRQVRRLEEIRRLNRELKRQVVHKESDLRSARAALREANLPLPAGGMIGNSAPMRAVHRLIERAAPSKLAVLVVGESGTGKELVARALHSLSPRAPGPFVSENCAAFPESLIESELFGYKKGAFTGADTDRPGLFERAEGGTLFLDEIGELPIELQAKLLRVLETGEVRRVGDSRMRHADFRLVAATNRDLEADVRAQKFRADLFYRLDGLRLQLPPLSDRVEDIPELVDHFLRLEAARTGVHRTIHPSVVARLCRRAWPGNVRELANEVTRLAILSDGDVSDPDLVRTPGATREVHAAEPGFGAMFAGGVPTMEELEKRAILHALEIAGGDKRKAAELLGISRAKVYQRLKEWRMDGGETEGA